VTFKDVDSAEKALAVGDMPVGSSQAKITKAVAKGAGKGKGKGKGDFGKVGTAAFANSLLVVAFFVLDSFILSPRMY